MSYSYQRTSRCQKLVGMLEQTGDSLVAECWSKASCNNRMPLNSTPPEQMLLLLRVSDACGACTFCRHVSNCSHPPCSFISPAWIKMAPWQLTGTSGGITTSCIRQTTFLRSSCTGNTPRYAASIERTTNPHYLLYFFTEHKILFCMLYPVCFDYVR